MLKKQLSLHHSVTELGNIQVRQVIKYVEDEEVKSVKYGAPYTPKDVKKMEGFDNRSKEIVATITAPEARVEFEGEKQVKKGKGIEEIITHDRVIEEDGKIAVRKIIRTFDNGVEVSKKYHRSWIMPGDDYSKADAVTKALAKKLHAQRL